ncbi:MAG: hypothetical protein ACKVQT_01295 [Burkholderiales bacterium]
MHLRLIVPELFWSHESPIPAHADLAARGIETLVARGRKRVRAVGSLEAWLLDAFGIPTVDVLPVAPFALLGDGVPHEERHWIRVDPVHLRVGRDDFTLLDATTMPLEVAEAAALTGALNEHFREQAMRFIAPAAGRWYMTGPTPITASTATLDQVRGRSVDALRPTGPGALPLQAFMNEVQMLLHDHPVNETRERRGLPLINSVWPWGAGQPHEIVAPAVVTIYTDDPLALGLARTAAIAAHPVPVGIESILHAPFARGVTWVVLDRLRSASAYRDLDAWRAGLAELEARWFAPALEALRSRRLGMITIHAIGASSALAVETTGGDLRYFWRRRKNLAAYINGPASTVSP